ncbi:MAG: hypothetical protein J6C50_00135 [Rickettsiales bacterium]|nr:hypothetical protein [Rickettsiales bacterium]
MNKILTISTIDKKILIILQSGSNIIDKLYIEEENRQAELLVVNMEKLLQKNNIWYEDLDCVSVINGPGSFIGLKVAIATVKAIKSVYNNIKVITNNVFEILSFRENFDFVVLKADMNGYYLYNNNKNISYIDKNYLENIDKPNNIIISNIKNIIDFFKQNTKLKITDINIEKIILLNAYKYENNVFSNEIKALYIMDPKINKRKNE